MRGGLRARLIAAPAVILLVAAATGVALLAEGAVPDGTLGMIYLVPVVAAAVGFGPVPGAAAAMLAFLTWNFLFLPPRLTFAIDGAQHLVGAAVFALVALLLAGTAGGLRQSASRSRRNAAVLRDRVALGRRLGAVADRADLVQAIAAEAARLAPGRGVSVLLPLPPAPGEIAPEPVLRAAAPPEAMPGPADMQAARLAMAWGRATGPGTGSLEEAGWTFHPLRGTAGILGLLGLQQPPPDARPPGEEAEAALEALLDHAAIALERADLAEERARAAARAEAEALRAALLTSLGHDLKTPLTAIRGAVATLRSAHDALPEETRADLLATAEEEAERLSRWIANILDMARIEHGQILPRREPVDLAEALEAAAQRAARAHGHRVALDGPPGLVAPRLDPALLDQVLANLLDNALKFSGPAGAVRLAARRDGAEVVITVEDDGPGIPAEDLPRVFDPFFRASRTDRVAAGSGLGLAICRALVHAMGGRIAAQSPIASDGRGTRMTLRFPGP